VFPNVVAEGNVEPVLLLLKSDKGEMAKIFDMFDKFRPDKNYMAPPLED
jgi:hypothetical protein